MKDINYIRHLNQVFELFSRDSRLNPSHISLYVALFHIWNHNFFMKEFYLNREEVMQYSKIGSKSTYHRCIKELSHWKYLLYSPSYNHFKGSRIMMFDFGTSNGPGLVPNRPKTGTGGGQELVSIHPKNETGGGQELVSINKHIQTIKNNKNKYKQENFKNFDFIDFKNDDKLTSTVPNQDNLKTTSNKNYNQPL